MNNDETATLQRMKSVLTVQGLGAINATGRASEAAAEGGGGYPGQGLYRKVQGKQNESNTTLITTKKTKKRF